MIQEGYKLNRTVDYTQNEVASHEFNSRTSIDLREWWVSKPWVSVKDLDNVKVYLSNSENEEEMKSLPKLKNNILSPSETGDSQYSTKAKAFGLPLNTS